MRLQDKVAVVTGGGGGLGAGICLSLAEAGAHVVVSDLSLENAEKTVQQVKETGRKAIAVRTDVSKKADCQQLVDTAVESMGQLDIMVCCAGIGGFVKPEERGEATLENISEEEWDLTIDVNLKGVFLCNQVAASVFKKQQSGKIINISSVGGRTGVEWIPHYSASKSGVIFFSQGIARQLAPHNINVNCICPGLIWTEMWRQGATTLAKGEAFAGMSLDEIFQAMVDEMIPMKRPQTPADIGNAVVFLASPEADQITGQSLNVCGGAAMN